MANLKVKAAFENPMIKKVTMVQVRRRKKHPQKHTHLAATQEAELTDKTKPTSATNPWFAVLKLRGGINRSLMVRVIAYDASGDCVACVSIPTRPGVVWP